MDDLEALAEARTGSTVKRAKPPRSITPWLLAIVAATAVAAGLLFLRMGPHDSSHSRGIFAGNTISGAIWLTRGDGSSDIQRGAKVVLLRGQVPAAAVIEGMKQAANELKRLAEEDRDDAKRYRGFARDFQGEPIKADYEEKARTSDAEAKTKAARAEAILATIPRITADVPTKNAFDLVTAPGLEWRPFVSSVVNAARMADATSDVEGKYNFSGVGPGDYFLYVSLNTSLFSCAWLVPAKAGDKIDLFNDNARYTHNN